MGIGSPHQDPSFEDDFPTARKIWTPEAEAAYLRDRARFDQGLGPVQEDPTERSAPDWASPFAAPTVGPGWATVDPDSAEARFQRGAKTLSVVAACLAGLALAVAVTALARAEARPAPAEVAP